MKKISKFAIALTMVVVFLTVGVVFAAGGGINKSIQVVLNGINLVVDGRMVPGDNILYNGTTFVPVRALAEALGKEVKWDAQTNTVEISDKDPGFVEKNGIKIYTKTVKYKDEYTDVSLKIPVIEGMKNLELMDRLNEELEKKALDLKKETEKAIKEVIEESKKQGWPLRTGSVYTEYEALINDNGTMSISVIYYEYSGGAHGYTFKETLNLDLMNEKELLLKELFDGSADYQKVLTDEILEEMYKEKENLFPETLQDFKASDNLNFYLTDEGIVFYFNPYEIAPYVRGIAEYKVPYESLKNVLNKDFARRFLNS